jgi:hypothetical protein
MGLWGDFMNPLTRVVALLSASALAAAIAVTSSGCSSAVALDGRDGGGIDATQVLQPDGDGAEVAADGPSCDPSLTYDSFGKAFFTTYCGRCHVWDQGAAQTEGDVITAAGGPGGFMPPGPPIPSDRERMRLATWIACGAP